MYMCYKPSVDKTYTVALEVGFCESPFISHKYFIISCEHPLIPRKRSVVPHERPLYPHKLSMKKERMLT